MWTYNDGRNVRSIIQRIMRDKGIEVELSANVVGTALGADGDTSILTCSDGRAFPFDEAIWCTQVVVAWRYHSVLQITTKRNEYSIVIDGIAMRR